MKRFLDDHFLLFTDTARKLYENAAKDSPTFDFHCHLAPKEIWENKPFENITGLWLGGDHYKWRVMRMHGIDERRITGNAEPFEKFVAWAETVPHLIGNPFYHWTHMELKMIFGIEQNLNLKTARAIYDACNEKLQQPKFRPRALIERSNVKFIGTTDDPVSDLKFHQLLKNDDTFDAIVAPTFRPDGALYIERTTFNEWLDKLSQASGIKVVSFDDLLKALKSRVDFFDENG